MSDGQPPSPGSFRRYCRNPRISHPKFQELVGGINPPKLEVYGIAGFITFHIFAWIALNCGEINPFEACWWLRLWRLCNYIASCSPVYEPNSDIAMKVSPFIDIYLKHCAFRWQC